jgi:hypothetical protein
VLAVQILIQLNNSGKSMYSPTSVMATAAIMAMAITYLRREGFVFFGWFASERFFLHLPDFVLSLSFDHLPFFTRGTGKKSLPLLRFLRKLFCL